MKCDGVLWNPASTDTSGIVWYLARITGWLHTCWMYILTGIGMISESPSKTIMLLDYNQCLWYPPSYESAHTHTNTQTHTHIYIYIHMICIKSSINLRWQCCCRQRLLFICFRYISGTLIHNTYPIIHALLSGLSLNSMRMYMVLFSGNGVFCCPGKVFIGCIIKPLSEVVHC